MRVAFWGLGGQGGFKGSGIPGGHCCRLVVWMQLGLEGFLRGVVAANLLGSAVARGGYTCLMGSIARWG